MVVVRGTVVATEDLVIDGQVHGTIELGDHNLTIGDVAVVVADLMAKSIVISGNVTGNVIGSTSVELKSTAKVEGDITRAKVRAGRRRQPQREGGYGNEEEGLGS
jgi:cytoskeletal protein CcmA (bactofilin family)